MASTSEYEQRKFWDESYTTNLLILTSNRIKEETEEWFCKTHDLYIEHLKQVKNG